MDMTRRGIAQAISIALSMGSASLHAQETAPVSAEVNFGWPGADRRDGAAARGKTAGRSARGHRAQWRLPDAERGHEDHGPERQSALAPHRQLQLAFLHERRHTRAAQPQRRTRSGFCRGLLLRRGQLWLSRRHQPADVRSAIGRGGQGAARHAVRPQYDRRRTAGHVGSTGAGLQRERDGRGDDVRQRDGLLGHRRREPACR